MSCRLPSEISASSPQHPPDTRVRMTSSGPASPHLTTTPNTFQARTAQLSPATPTIRRGNDGKGVLVYPPSVGGLLQQQTARTPAL